jgi:surface polysaccharide O-acyltransferase-like enzyme
MKSDFYWLPSCFVMMPFVAVILTPHFLRLKDSPSKRYCWICITLAVGGLAALVEWHFAAPSELIDPATRHWVTKHARLSVQFFAIAMLIASLGIQKPVNRIIRFFARNSLGVYCLHPFMLSSIVLPVKKILQPWVFGFATPIGCIVVAIVCSFLTEFLRLTFKQRLV